MNKRLQKFLESGDTLQILADENMPGINEYFSYEGLSGLNVHIQKKSGREITAIDIKNVHVLLIRSVTQVNQSLLNNCEQLFFIGSATIGVNHVDQGLLTALEIQFEYAPGCNAQGVAEYVLSAIALHRPHIFERKPLRVGLVGFGNTGSRVFDILKSLDVEVCVYDPFKQMQQKNDDCLNVDFVSYEEVLSSDVISFHVPYTKAGEYPTDKMLNEKALSLFNHDSLLINTSRGEVFDQDELSKYFSANEVNSSKNLVLDVWENEPSIDSNMVDLCNTATPHIAGYTWEGKWRGTLQLYEKLCNFMKLDVILAEEVFPTIIKEVTLDKNNEWHQIFNLSYDLQADDKKLRDCIKWPLVDLSLGQQFDFLRKNYPQRCEWKNTYIISDDEHLNNLSVESFIHEKIYKTFK